MVHGRKIFSSRVIEKHQQHQHNLFHNFIDFKKAFDRVWLVGLWRVFKSFNIEEGLFQAIQTRDEKSILNGCETWIRAFETNCPRKLLCVFYLEQKTSHWAQSKVGFLVGPQEPPLTTVKRKKLAWLRHVACQDILSKIILQSSLEGGQL